MHGMITMHCTPVPDEDADGQTDEHYRNGATIRFNERIAR